MAGLSPSAGARASAGTVMTHFVLYMYGINILKVIHYNDVIMSAMASQITSLMIVYSAVYSRRRSQKTSKLPVTGLCAGNSPVTGEFPAQRASNAENVSICWRHHELADHNRTDKIYPQLPVANNCSLVTNLEGLLQGRLSIGLPIIAHQTSCWGQQVTQPISSICWVLRFSKLSKDCSPVNTLRPRQMDAISQTTFSNAFSWMKMFEFRLKIHWSLFPRVELTIS